MVTRSRILAAALGRFARGDYADASLKDIATDVGIKAPSIYAHFASKEELYTEVYENSLSDHREYFVALIEQSQRLEPLERLRGLLFGVRDFYRTRPDHTELHLRTTLSHNLARARGLADAFQVWDTELSAAVSEAYLDGVKRGQLTSMPAQAFTSHCLCLMDGAFLQLAYYSPELYDEHLNQTWASLEHMLTQVTPQETTA